MANPFVVLLIVLFPPPQVLAQQPNAQPIIQAAHVESIDACQAEAQKLRTDVETKMPGALIDLGCIVVKSPDSEPAPAAPAPTTPGI